MASIFDSLAYGKIKTVDLHGLTREEARAEITLEFESVDTDIKGIEFVHGYHAGRVLRNFIRRELDHPMIAEKIAISASSTIILLNFEHKV